MGYRGDFLKLTNLTLENFTDTLDYIQTIVVKKNQTPIPVFEVSSIRNTPTLSSRSFNSKEGAIRSNTGHQVHGPYHVADHFIRKFVLEKVKKHTTLLCFIKKFVLMSRLKKTSVVNFIQYGSRISFSLAFSYIFISYFPVLYPLKHICYFHVVVQCPTRWWNCAATNWYGQVEWRPVTLHYLLI